MSIDYSNFAFPKQKNIKEKKLHRLKQKSSKLAKMERNRMSILTDNMNECFICGKKATDKHEVFRGRNRQKSMKYKLVVPLCRMCHILVDNDKEASELLLEEPTEKIFIKKYGEEKFIEEFK